MYITIINIVGEKRIDLAYSINNSNKEVTVVGLFSDNIQYEFREPWMVELGESRNKGITTGTYTRRKLIDIVEEKIEMTQSDNEEPHVIKQNKLEGITEVVFSLDEIDNTNNFSNGLPSNTLFMHHVTILHISNPTLLSIRNLRKVILFP